MLELSQTQARNLHLAAQGLLVAPRARATPMALRRCVERMQLLQIDTIHVVARSPYLVLFSRLGDYPVQWLDQALAQGQLFESWAHEACLVPMAELALHRSCYNQQARRHWGLARGEADQAEQRIKLDALLQHIAANGPVKSSDFEHSYDRSSAWWGWKDEKRWLEALFARGELMVARREKFQRVYDLAHGVCPTLAQLELPAVAEVHQRFMEKSILALGVTQARWVHDYFRIKPRLKDADLEPLLRAGRVQQVQVQGWSAPGYVHTSHARLLNSPAALRERLRKALQSLASDSATQAGAA